MISPIICGMNSTPLKYLCLCLMFSHILICFLHIEAADFSAKIILESLNIHCIICSEFNIHSNVGGLYYLYFIIFYCQV